jgi:beta-glucosidase/6-phospho-beta-glucosidase/beta-galactosidase
VGYEESTGFKGRYGKCKYVSHKSSRRERQKNERLFKEAVAENFLKLEKDVNIQI